MTKEHLQSLETLLRPLAGELPRQVELQCKHFFSGAAAYANGRICITLTPVGLALKLPEEARAELTRRGAEPLRYFQGGPVKTHYVVVPRRLREDRDELAVWARASIDYVLTLPAPRAR